MSGVPFKPFVFEADPDNPGWLVTRIANTGRFMDIYGDVRVRIESDRVARIRLQVEERHRNIKDGAHGGYLMAAVDQALFVGPAQLGIDGALGGSTLDVSTQFLAPVAIGEPIDIVTEVLRVTGRMIFLRGLIEQNGVNAVSFSATVRKHSSR